MCNLGFIVIGSRPSSASIISGSMLDRSSSVDWHAGNERTKLQRQLDDERRQHRQELDGMMETWQELGDENKRLRQELAC